MTDGIRVSALSAKTGSSLDDGRPSPTLGRSSADQTPGGVSLVSLASTSKLMSVGLAISVSSSSLTYSSPRPEKVLCRLVASSAV